MGGGEAEDLPCSFSVSMTAFMSFSSPSAVTSLSWVGREVDHACNSSISSMSIVLSSTECRWSDERRYGTHILTFVELCVTLCLVVEWFDDNALMVECWEGLGDDF